MKNQKKRRRSLMKTQSNDTMAYSMMMFGQYHEIIHHL